MSRFPQHPSEALHGLLTSAVESLLPEGGEAPRLQVDRSKAGFTSDFQTAAALQLAKTLRKSPRDIAPELAARLSALGGSLIEEPEISGPGFVGFRLTTEALQGYLSTLLADSERLGVGQLEGKIVVDFSSPNVAKRMHIGHIRSTVIGDALCRMGRFLYGEENVIGDNHIGDWGTQFGQIICAYKDPERLDEAAYRKDPVGELERLYVQFNRDTKDDPSLMDSAREELRKLQAGDEENYGLWTQFREDSRGAFESVYKRLKVVFGLTRGESYYNDRLPGLVEDLLSHDIAEVSEKAVCVKFPGESEDDKPLLPPFLVQKSDKAFLYATTDLATVESRLKPNSWEPLPLTDWQPTRIVYVTDHRQKLHFDQLFATCEMMAEAGMFEGSLPEMVHVPFGIMSLPEGSISTRGGNTIRLDELLDEAERRALKTQEERRGAGGDDVTDKELEELAETIGIGAVKYADLSNNPASNIVFSFDKMLSFEGNTAPYLQYTSARTHSLRRRAQDAGHKPDGRSLRLEDPLERQLLLHLVDFGPAVEAGFDAGKPSTLATYLHELASLYHRWYAACPVLKSEDAELITSRLNLNQLTQETLTLGLDLLGIGAPERM